MGFAHLLQRLLLLLGQRFCRRHRSPPSSRRIADGRQLGHSDHARIDGVIGHDHLGRAACREKTRPALKCTILHLPEACGAARRFIDETGLSARIDTRSLDMFKGEWPHGCDAILLSNLCMTGRNRAKDSLHYLQDSYGLRVFIVCRGDANDQGAGPSRIPRRP
jgi:hypothetical protein